MEQAFDVGRKAQQLNCLTQTKLVNHFLKWPDLATTGNQEVDRLHALTMGLPRGQRLQ